MENLYFEEPSDNQFNFNSYKYGIIVILPQFNNNISSQVAIADNIFHNLQDEKITISKRKTQIINIKNSEEKEESLLGLYNYFSIFGKKYDFY